LLERLAGLGSRIVELACLADDDRPSADDQDAFYVVPTRHGMLFTLNFKMKV
jgi:hypothetical protein